MSWEIRQGNALDRLREMPDESVQCCVTSPPYWGLRDYDTPPTSWPAMTYALPGGEVVVEEMSCCLGLEETPEQCVGHLVLIMREVERILRKDGTLWLNIGDSYNANQGTGFDTNGDGGARKAAAATRRIKWGKPKDLVGIPWMVAFALRAEGWYLRRDIIWSKPNPMPESVTDRPATAHEYLFLLSKSPRYFYDSEAIREPATFAGPNGAQKSPHAQGFGRRTREEEKARQDKQRGHHRRHDGFNDRWDAMSKNEQQALGRNKRSVWEAPEELWAQFLRWLAEQPTEKPDVWSIATRPFLGAHFATFPPDLVEPCILAGTPPKSCGECGAPWRRLTECEFVPQQDVAHSPALQRSTDGLDSSSGWGETPRGTTNRTTIGWEPTCDHNDATGRALVLDPFAGAATTALVATQQNRDFVGIELSPESIELGEDRIRRWEANPAGHLKGDPEPLEGQIAMTVDDVLADIEGEEAA